MQKGITVQVKAPPPASAAPSGEPPRKPSLAAWLFERRPKVQPPGEVGGGIYTKRDFVRCVIIALVVGTALVIVNVRPVPGEGPDLGRIFINYLVPFLVSTTSAMLANDARIRAARRGSR